MALYLTALFAITIAAAFIIILRLFTSPAVLQHKYFDILHLVDFLR
jgi:hypothetical protein